MYKFHSLKEVTTEDKEQRPSALTVTYTLTRSFATQVPDPGYVFSFRIVVDMVTGGQQCCDHFGFIP